MQIATKHLLTSIRRTDVPNKILNGTNPIAMGSLFLLVVGKLNIAPRKMPQ